MNADWQSDINPEEHEKRSRAEEIRDKGQHGGVGEDYLNMPPAPTNKRGWSEEHRERFKRTMRRKKRQAEAAKAEAAKTGDSEFRIEDIALPMTLSGTYPKNPPKEDLPQVLACPRCGLSIRNVALAIAFSDKQ
jgi:hypothetical protein